jgi:hypothetical protein
LTWKYAWRHSRVQFFDISTSKGASGPRCFYTFALGMFFPPQWGAFFADLFAADLSAPAALAT